jgi:energy-coupling factor transporter ATP-binding protein EcfA2
VPFEDPPATHAPSGDGRRFDVFLSHNSRDKPFVLRIGERLKRAGLEPWLDQWSLTPGGRWQDELTEGLAASSACAVFIGPSDLGDWEREELAVAQNRAATEREFRLFPVLLPGLPEPFQASGTWVDFRRGYDDERALQLLVNAIKGIPAGPEFPFEPLLDVSPYRGLQTFDEEHANFFYGREADVQRVLEKLKASRFLAVVGPSGSGKSSLVRAGLLPALRRGSLPSSDTWRIRVLMPSGHPLTVFAAHLLRLYPQGTMQQTLERLAVDERTAHLAVSLALAEQPNNKRIVWVVDQAEEIFTLCRDERERKAFLGNLLYAASVPGGQSSVVLTLRADFYSKAAAYPELAQHLAEQQYLVGPLDDGAMRRVIEEPARRVGLEFEPGLVGTILDEVAQQPGALPLLEHALLELWERRRGRMLTARGLPRVWRRGACDREAGRGDLRIVHARAADDRPAHAPPPHAARGRDGGHPPARSGQRADHETR